MLIFDLSRLRSNILLPTAAAPIGQMVLLPGGSILTMGAFEMMSHGLDQLLLEV